MPAPPVSQSPKAAHVAIVVPDDKVPPPPLPPRPSAPPMSDTQPTAQPNVSPALGGLTGSFGNDLASARPTQPSIESVSAPDFTLVRKREEEPRPDAPITYREYAYAVDPGTDRKAAEVLLWQRFRELSQQIAGRPKGKFIQLAVFDHVFEKRPLRRQGATAVRQGGPGRRNRGACAAAGPALLVRRNERTGAALCALCGRTSWLRSHS